MRKIVSFLVMIKLVASVALADLIREPWPGPITNPEPEDDGELVVIKVLFFAAIIISVIVTFYKRYKINLTNRG